MEKLKCYNVGVFCEVAGYIKIKANNKKEAIKKAEAICWNEGAEAIEDVTHRDVMYTDVKN